MDLVRLQREVNDRWSLQVGNPCHESADAPHALLHLTKAIGKIASEVNDAQHERRPISGGAVSKYLADLVICAARFADGIVDIDAACRERLEEKFPDGASVTPVTP